MIVEEYGIHHLSCASCSAKIEKEISNLPHVAKVNLDLISAKLKIEYYHPLPNSLQKLNQIAQAIEPGSHFSAHNQSTPKSSMDYKWLFIGLGIAVYVLSFVVPMIPTLYMMLLSFALIGHRILTSAVLKLGKLRLLEEHFLMSIAALGAMYLGEYGEGLAVLLLYEIGQVLESRSVNKSRNAIQKILALKPQRTWVFREDELISIPTAEVLVGETIQINAGDLIPLDGTIISGESEIDTSSLTGESEPRFVSTGDPLFAGSVNGGGTLKLKVTGDEAHSTINKIMAMIEDAASRKAPTEQLITRIAKIYTPTVVALALLIVCVPLILGGAFDVWFPRALIFLIVSCPCALLISIPLSYYVGIGLAAKQGIIFKGSVFLDLMRKVQIMVFDKTGTITTGKPQISAIVALADISQQELLHIAKTCERFSTHPFAKTILSYAQNEEHQFPMGEYHEYAGRGIVFSDDLHSYYCGSNKLLSKFSIPIPSSSREPSKLRNEYHNMQSDTAYPTSVSYPEQSSIIFIARDNACLGYISLEDEIKPGIGSTLSRLKSLGIKKTYILSGDRDPKVNKIAQALGFDGFYSELLPDDKISKLENIMANTIGATAYVGDGLNDSPVLSRADIGIAMGEIGNPAAVESADVVLLNDRAEQILKARLISQKTHHIVIQNISLAFGIKFAVMILGSMGLGTLWEAVIADVGVTILAVFNAMRISKISMK